MAKNRDFGKFFDLDKIWIYNLKNSNFKFSSFRLEGMEASAKKDAGVGREEPDKEAPPQDEESFDGEITESDQI